ncbi:MAG: RNA 2'-phosphotransferase [Sumerlaeia bacterium]
MNPKHEIRISKFFSLVLRHDPAKAGLTLDANGWAQVEALLAGCGRAGLAVTREELDHVVANNPKKRFALSPDGARIRASQGHSVAVDLALAAQTPPEILFHGTADRNLASIKDRGLVRGGRQHVHLSLDEETAFKVGQRHGRPLILRVRAAEMAAAGFAFHCSENGVWLVDEVPAEYLEY